MKCEICGNKIKGQGAYLNTRRVCRRCFNRSRYSNRTGKYINYI